MSTPPKGPSNQKKGTGAFTLDHDSSGVMDMPGITKLLNRKSLSGSSTSTKSSESTQRTAFPPARPPAKPPEPDGPILTPQLSPPPVIASPPLEITLAFEAPEGVLELQGSSAEPLPANSSVDGPAISLSGPESSPPTSAISDPAVATVKTPTVRTSGVERRSSARLALWDPKQLKGGADPLGRGLAMLLDKGVQAAAFLSIQPPPAGSPVPHFLASAAIATQERLALWTGMKWDPTIVPELWNLFVREGFVELSPPGTQTNIKSNRNVVRGAFGVAQSEWLTLVRAGPAAGCRGVLGLISDRSLVAELKLAMPLIAASPGSVKKAS